MARVALCIIATNKYRDFIDPLLVSANEYFLNDHNVDYHCFVNELCQPTYLEPFGNRLAIYRAINHDKWPFMTLKRYQFISSVDLSGYDYVYYIDADMRFVGHVGNEIFGDLVGVLHPGYYRGGGAWCGDNKSKAYVMPSKRSKYLAGGFQGGAKYWEYAKLMADRIQFDLDKGIIATWHDESHWNWLYVKHPDLFKILTPDYCYPEDERKAKAWGISNFEPKVLALEKNHKTIRS